jgi:MocE subfamily Rieske [2Fe-2S] domain protein
MTTALPRDYRLTGPEAARAIQRGLAEADWYTCPVPREAMRSLLERRDGPALRDTLLWFALLGLTGWAGYALWGSWWAILPFACYGLLYASVSDSRWHESSHGTAFRTGWMNDALYEIASFLVMRESTIWRWSHTRHHSDTIIVGRDPEIAVPRPPSWWHLAAACANLRTYPRYFTRLCIHATGRMCDDERTFVPASEFPAVYRRARIHLAIHLAVAGLAVHAGSILPLMYVGLPNLYGAWLMVVYGLTQHAGLAEDVLDHRRNCRTVLMDPVNRWLYWNMGYHIEHHMFPLVPYHALPRLHALIRDDTPTPYPGLFAAYREIIPALARQRREPDWYVQRPLPPARPAADSRRAHLITDAPDADGWLGIGPATRLAPGQAMRIDHGRRTFAVYRTVADTWHATDGVCTHGNSHLAEGLVHGRLIECPKHNGRFDLDDGRPVRPPVCRALRTWPVRVRDGLVQLNVTQPGGAGAASPERALRLRVAATRMATPWIAEIDLEPVDPPSVACTPGDYLQVDIPDYGRIAYRDLALPGPIAARWRAHGLDGLVAAHPGTPRRNNYSLANGPGERLLRLTVRIAPPPPGSALPPGVGSAYMLSLKPGDIVTAVGPAGDFHIKPTQREMLYIGGGAGMAPIRAHLLALFGTQPTARRVTFWYGARSRHDLLYEAELTALATRHANLAVRFALSEPLPDDAWTGEVGLIHTVVERTYLAQHAQPTALECYLCGPPRMIEACTAMLDRLGIDPQQIAYDAF